MLTSLAGLVILVRAGVYWSFNQLCLVIPHLGFTIPNMGWYHLKVIPPLNLVYQTWDRDYLIPSLTKLDIKRPILMLREAFYEGMVFISTFISGISTCSLEMGIVVVMFIINHGRDFNYSLVLPLNVQKIYALHKISSKLLQFLS